MASRYVDKKTLAEHFDVSVRTIEDWTFRRKIPFVRLSRKCVRYDLDAIDTLVAEKTVPVGGTGRKSAP